MAQLSNRASTACPNPESYEGKHRSPKNRNPYEGKHRLPKKSESVRGQASLAQKPLVMRLFAAIPLDAVARTYVAMAQDALQREGVRARWIPPENWHVTLAFLGDVDDARLPAIADAFNSAVGQAVRGQPSPAEIVAQPPPDQKSIAPFSLQLSSIGAFPNSRRPRVIWVGGTEHDPAFEAAALAMRAAFTPLGFRFDDAVTAHVTIGRANGSTPLHPLLLDNTISMPVTRFALFESVRGPAGVRYVEREQVILS
jgi:2'-5' RNA ligase